MHVQYTDYKLGILLLISCAHSNGCMNPSAAAFAALVVTEDRMSCDACAPTAHAVMCHA